MLFAFILRRSRKFQLITLCLLGSTLCLAFYRSLRGFPSDSIVNQLPLSSKKLDTILQINHLQHQESIPQSQQQQQPQHFQENAAEPWYGIPVDTKDDITAKHKETWSPLEKILTGHAPNCTPPNITAKIREPFPLFRLEKGHRGRLAECITLDPSSLEKMKTAHDSFITSIATNPLPLHYYPGTRGIVSTANSNQLPVLVVSLRMLRRTGSTLPVEVFLARQEDYEPYICDVVLPSLNAKCLLFSSIVGEDFTLQGYQFKPFSLLFSSFESALFLDSDVFPLRDPAYLFRAEPFNSHGFVTWPDFWASTASPTYYAISGIPEPELSFRATTESGALLISRRTHTLTLFLTAYYNHYGPDYYYRLFTQTGAGEGDKETWLAAATALNQSHYQVSFPIGSLGRSLWGKDNGAAMVQYDPVVDYQRSLLLHDNSNHNNPTDRTRARTHGRLTARHPSPLFVHANQPKFNPRSLVSKNDDQNKGPTWFQGRRTRIWPLDVGDVIGILGEQGVVKPTHGGPQATEAEAMRRDVEKEVWEEVIYVACELEGKFDDWKWWDDVKVTMCERVLDAWNDLFEGSTGSTGSIGSNRSSS